MGGFGKSAGVTYGSRSCPKGGQVFWCNRYDDQGVWKWCDWNDGKWKDQSLDKACAGDTQITSVSCFVTGQIQQSDNHEMITTTTTTRTTTKLDKCMKKESIICLAVSITSCSVHIPATAAIEDHSANT